MNEPKTKAGLIIASHHFFEPDPQEKGIAPLSLSTMNYLLIRFAYPPLSGYGQFEKAYTLKPGEDLELTIGPSPFTPDWKLMKKSEVYNNIYINAEVPDERRLRE